MGPAADVELVFTHVGAAQLLVVGRRLVDLARLDLEVERRRLEAAHAGPSRWTGKLRWKAKPPAWREISSRTCGAGGLGDVGLAAELEGLQLDRQLEPFAFAGAEREAGEVDDGFRGSGHTSRDYGDGSDSDWKPDDYLDLIRSEVPRYDELQEQAIAAIPFAPERVLELGMGTGETTRRLIEAYPDAWVIGLDSSPDMVFRARENYDDVQLARMEDPLPDGPWDLVIGVLSIHHLRAEQKQELFRRVREHSRALVIGDVVRAEAAGHPDRGGLRLPGGGRGLAELDRGRGHLGRPTTWRWSPRD